MKIYRLHLEESQGEGAVHGSGICSNLLICWFIERVKTTAFPDAMSQPYGTIF